MFESGLVRRNPFSGHVLLGEAATYVTPTCSLDTDIASPPHGILDFDCALLASR